MHERILEYQVAGHMIAEGLVQEGLAITRMLHDRYQAARRNPWNEVECGDHYARSMASYGVFLTACGYEHDGPRGHLGFAPRLRPQNFKCAFTTAEGWGSYSQQVRGGVLHVRVELRYGRLRLSSLALRLPAGMGGNTFIVIMAGQPVAVRRDPSEGWLRVRFEPSCRLEVDQTLEVRVA